MYARSLVFTASLAFISQFLGVTLGQTETAALSGRISSEAEAAMEGVLVSASKAGSSITITVVSDKDGRFSFPAGRLPPGQYSLVVRAIGYELDGPSTVEIPEQKVAVLDLKLRKTEDLAAQLSNGEWLTSIPGTDKQKNQLL